MIQKRKKRKAKKKIEKRDSFQLTMTQFYDKLKAYKYIILLAVVVILLFVFATRLRRSRQQQRSTTLSKLLEADYPISPAEFEKALTDCHGQALEPWAILGYANSLHRQYRDSDMYQNDKSNLRKAREALQKVIKDFPERGPVVYAAKASLAVINEDLEYEVPAALLEKEKSDKEEPSIIIDKAQLPTVPK